MSACRTLLGEIRLALERTYRMDSGLGDLAPFVIGDYGFRMLYGHADPSTVAGHAASGAKTLVREHDDVLHARIYFPDALIEQLERFPPHAGVDRRNVGEFAIFVEEIDHLLLIAERARRQRPVSLFELELHANVSKHLVLARYLAGATRRIGPFERAWLRDELFGDGEYREALPAVRQRYRDAARHAVRFLELLPRLYPHQRLDMLRRFHHATASGKLALIRETRSAVVQ